MSTNWISRRPARAKRTGVKSLYGFAQPYDFTRALPFIAAIAMLLVIVATGAGDTALGKVNWGTYRSAYFIYLGSVALLAALLSFAPRLAWPLIALVFLDFSLGFGTSALTHMKFIAYNIMPADSVTEQYVFHPLLQATPNPNFVGHLPVEVRHNSQGLRGPERDPERLKQQTVIAAIGGSTTYDLGVAEGQTWPERLEHLLGTRYAVLNHGVPTYATVENLIQTLFYLESYGVAPHCAIYYEGWNDVRNAHDPHLDPGYADFHLLDKYTWMQARRRPLFAEISPLGRITVSYLQRWIDTVPTAESLFNHSPSSGSDPLLEKYFRKNLETIAAVNKSRGITTIFVGQVLNRARLHDTQSHSWWPLVRDADVWPLQTRFNTILKETADSVGVAAFVPPIGQFQDSDFVDKGHFSAQGSEKFSAMLAPVVRANCTQNH
ncbi:MAG TPA: hypothetical protein VMV19_21670 [Xanthobacteraceae bacterium]|nr:hypothetical protein [Xanthobacteraceae bacterium]